jgi:hypothetical protein
MADNYQKRSGKATRQHYKKDRRESVVQVRMNDAEVALLDTKRGTVSRSLFLRRSLYDDAENTHKLVTVHIPELEGVRMDLNRIGVNVNQISRHCNTAAKNARPWSTTSTQTCTQDDMKVLDECAQELRKANAILECLAEKIRKQAMEIQLSKLHPATREYLESYGDDEHRSELVDELLSDVRDVVGGDV